MLLAVYLAIGITLYQGTQQKGRLTADQDTLAAMRSAIAIYYGQHGTFPDHPGRYVSPSPPVFRCTGFAYVCSPTMGDLKISSANDVTDCP